MEPSSAGSNLDLRVGRPLMSRKRQSLAHAVQRLRTELNHPGTALLLGLGGEHDHWTVVYRITQVSILLLDSAGIKRIAIGDCRMWSHNMKPEAW